MLDITKSNFKSEVLDSVVPVLVDFWAPWCGPCQMMLPVVEEISREIDSAKARIVKVNVEGQRELAEEYGVMSVPTFILFREGKETKRVMGPQSKEALLELLK